MCIRVKFFEIWNVLFFSNTKNKYVPIKREPKYCTSYKSSCTLTIMVK